MKIYMFDREEHQHLVAKCWSHSKEIQKDTMIMTEQGKKIGV